MARKSQKLPCPKCGGNSYWYTFDNEFGYCFLCGYREHKGKYAGRQKERSPHIEEIRNYYKQLAHYYHSSLDKAAIDFLYRRGFTDDTIRRFLIGYCSAGRNPLYRDPIGIEAGLALPHDQTGFLAGRITFPYFYDKDTICDIRGRALDPNEETKYKSPYNSSYYRGADYLYNNHLASNDTILISEGEIKADLATQIGFPTLAMPGMNNSKTFSQRAEQKVIIVFDSQVRNQHFVNQAISKLASRLSNPFVAVLPLMGRDKMDIDSFILEYGADLFAAVINGALTYEHWKQLQRF